jgi:hypothetical protein
MQPFNNFVTSQPIQTRAARVQYATKRKSTFQMLPALQSQRAVTDGAQSTRARTFSRGMRRQRLQAWALGTNMSLLSELDRRLELIIQEPTLRTIVPHWSEFDSVWESANKVCDQYQMNKGHRRPPNPFH